MTGNLPTHLKWNCWLLIVKHVFPFLKVRSPNIVPEPPVLSLMVGSSDPCDSIPWCSPFLAMMKVMYLILVACDTAQLRHLTLTLGSTFVVSMFTLRIDL